MLQTSAATLKTYRPKATYASKQPKLEARSKLRPIFLRGDVVSQSTGSAACELGNTKVICSIHGPRPRRQGGRGEFSDKGTLDVYATYAPFSRRFPDSDAQEKAGRELSRYLETCLGSSVQLSRFPKSALEIHLVVLEDDGSSRSCATLCASFALAKTGIEMIDIVTSCSLRLLPSGEIYVDPELDIENLVQPVCDVAFMTGQQTLSGFEFSSNEALAEERLGELLRVGLDACLEMSRIARLQLKQEFSDGL